MKNCAQCSAAFTVTDEDRQMLEKLSPTIGGQTFALPEPTLCPDCRQQRRLAFRNERKLYKRSCDLCRKEIVSIYHQDHSFPVYCQSCWWSDSWDARDYGQEFDFGKGLFEQLEILQKRVPRVALINKNSENSEYTHLETDTKNCYMDFGGHFNEDCYYNLHALSCKNCVDNYWTEESELCYECYKCFTCHQTLYSYWCFRCSECFFCSDCKNCSDCFGCSGLRRKKYHFFNTPLSQKEYEQKLQEFFPLTPDRIAKAKTLFQKMDVQLPHRHLVREQCEHVQGDMVKHGKNSFFVFEVENIEDSRYCEVGLDIKDSCDISRLGYGIELCYEGMAGTYHYRTLFTNFSFDHLSESLYIDNCFSSHDLFACIGLRNAQYCILNKQYTKEQYEALVPQIIAHMSTERRSASGGQNPPQSPFHKGGRTAEWGEFFPIELSPFAYNETVAQEYFPMTKEDLPGFKNLAGLGSIKWREEEDKIPEVAKKIPAEKLPDNINDIPDDILNWAIICQRSKRPYLIQKPELAFYRKMGLPIPRLHPDERHKDRMAKRNPRKLWKRQCAECNKEIETTYAPERPEKVLCEECYLKAVY